MAPWRIHILMQKKTKPMQTNLFWYVGSHLHINCPIRVSASAEVISSSRFLVGPGTQRPETFPFHWRNGKRTETKKRCTARLRSGRKSQNARWVLPWRSPNSSWAKLPLRLFYILPTCLFAWVYLSIELSGCIFLKISMFVDALSFFFREKIVELVISGWRVDGALTRWLHRRVQICSCSSWICSMLRPHNLQFFTESHHVFFSPRFHLVELVESFFRFSSDVCLNCFCIEILWCAISKLI